MNQIGIVLSPPKKTEVSEADLSRDSLPEDFESALRELELCVSTMERADLTLEASLAAYQRGVALAQICQQKLTAAQQKVQVLEGGLLKPLAQDQGETPPW